MTSFSGRYADNWRDIAEQTKRDAGYACVRCGHPHNPKAGRTLTVHHFDGDKANNRPWNLMALCQACHLSVQARVDPRTALMFDPRRWAMPYIAGMYEDGQHSPPPPGYCLARWIREYTRDGAAWPAWAPRPPQENA